MQLEQTLETYRPAENSRPEQRVYTIVNLESLSASALYTGEPCGGGFGPASSVGLGPGIARKMPEAGGMIERIRGPGAGDSSDADHINYEYLIPGVKKPLANIHIPLYDEDD